jgi:hypothetical protein
MHGPHMNRLRWRAPSDKNVIFLGGAMRELRVETASQEFAPDQSGARRAGWNARSALSFDFVI